MTHPVHSAIAWSVADAVATVQIHRPDKANALDEAGWHALRDAFEAIDARDDVRVVLLHGAGPHFCAGIDLELLAALPERFSASGACGGRSREALEGWITGLQACVTAVEACRFPVIAALHGVCFGGGMDIACAADIRLASDDLRACVKEVDLAVTADLGVLQRLPRIVGGGVARELALTARSFDAPYAERVGFVSRTYPDRRGLLDGAMALAQQLCGKSPLALRGTKRAMVNGHASVQEGLREVAAWNAATLLSTDLDEAIAAVRQRRAPRYPS